MRSAPEWYDNPVLEVMLLDHDKPTNYEEEMMSLDSAKWLEAMKSEMRSMYENKVWTLIDLPNDRRAIEIKWIFKRKTGADSSVTIYKPRIVCLPFKIHMYLTALRPSSSSSKVYTLFSYMDPLSDFMASSHLSESRPTIASP